MQTMQQSPPRVHDMTTIISQTILQTLLKQGKMLVFQQSIPGHTQLLMLAPMLP